MSADVISPVRLVRPEISGSDAEHKTVEARPVRRVFSGEFLLILLRCFGTWHA
jgi:hypothetical protein